MLGIVCWVLGIVSWVSGIVIWVLGFVFWVSGIVCWVLGIVSWVSGIVIRVLGLRIFWRLRSPGPQGNPSQVKAMDPLCQYIQYGADGGVVRKNAPGAIWTHGKC